ncbi:uncharacterized protein LOC113209486 [Frankliniella occidentalis]|uniref:Uncharacterized protein LOC113209486 n=1 Tax=Frankliniella occidentalis TaxID=133901 RepID=A0A9C6X3T4_FRAOC|nr:uncharacterized protein LOC113209486 [Frankliniella occidentalis]
MARNMSSSDRSIPHLRDIFWSGGPAPGGGQVGAHPQPAAPAAPGRTEWRVTPRHDDMSELTYQFQGDARISSRAVKGGGKDQHSNYHHNGSSHHHGKQSANNDLGNDSAISVGSTSEDEHQAAPTNKKKSKKSRARDNARTLTERDVKHLERHLSMKKTIRKKIMRDLQQAFVEDPTEFRVEDINSHEQLIQSLSFGTPSRYAQRHTSRESNFLDMLRANDQGSAQGGLQAASACTPCPPCAPAARRGGGGCDDQDSGHGSPRGSPTRDLSADRGMPPSVASQQQHLDEYDDGTLPETDSSGKKTSFWRRFTMKGKSKR